MCRTCAIFISELFIFRGSGEIGLRVQAKGLIGWMPCPTAGQTSVRAACRW